MKLIPSRICRLVIFALGHVLTVPLAYADEEFNYDESKVPEYVLPDVLLGSNGRKVSRADEWSERREEILQSFAENVYGHTPASAKSAKFNAKTGLTFPDFLDGKATLREVALRFENQVINLLIVTPNEATKASPAIFGLNFSGNHTVHPDPRISIPSIWVPKDRDGLVIENKATEKSRGAAASRWPIEKMIDQGFAFVTFYCGDVDPDFDDGFQNGVHEIFGKPEKNEWGSIATWAWGLGRGLDYLIEDKEIDGSKVAVFGFSRLGKCALWAGAVDERFALVISNESGCGGAALSRRAYGETVERINTSFPHWFCDNFQQFNGNEAALPVDQHMLIALIAPRPIYIGSAEGDRWADPKGEFLSGRFAEPVYELFGRKGLGVTEQPEVECSVGDFIAYHVRKGPHDVTDFDWEQYLNFTKRHFSK